MFLYIQLFHIRKRLLADETNTIFLVYIFSFGLNLKSVFLCVQFQFFSPGRKEQLASGFILWHFIYPTALFLVQPECE